MITPTPSVTASNTPSYSPTETACPTQTPTNTPTNTATPSVTPSFTPTQTSCYEPLAYVLFDSRDQMTTLNAWMQSQGSTFRGMNLNGPSTVPATFERQMNAYISFSGFGPSQYYALLPQVMTVNENPLVWTNPGPAWSDTPTWVNMIVPTCPLCDGGSYTDMGASDVILASTNSTYRNLPFYYSGTAIPVGYYRLHTSYSGTNMRLSNNNQFYNLQNIFCPVPPPTATPTPTATPNRVCPEILVISDSVNPEIIDGTYYRSSVYSGGTFNYGYQTETGLTQTLKFTTAPDGFNYPIYQYFDGTNYHTIYRRFSEYDFDFGWYLNSEPFNILMVGFGLFPDSLGWGTSYATYFDVRYPKPGPMGFSLQAVISYPELCPTPSATQSATPTVTPTNTSTPNITPSVTTTTTETPTMTPTPSVTPEPSNCLCFSTTYETIPSGLQVRWRDCETGTVTTQNISSLITRDNLDGTYTSFICVEQGLSYETPVCVSGGTEVSCDPLTWVEGGICSDSIDCDTVDECVCYQYTNDGDPEEVNSISYLDCNYEFQQIDDIPFGTSGYFCAILGSVTETEGLTYIEVNESFCDGCIANPQLCITVFNNSLDITITDVYVNGIQATPIGTWPNTTGNGGSLTIALVPGTYSVEVFHSCSISGQRVSAFDSNSLNQCTPISTGSSSTTFSGVNMDNIQCLEILAQDGACV